MESINTDEIISSLETQGIKVVLVSYAEFKFIELAGNLENFIATTKAFNENVVFLQSFSFDEDDFFYELKNSVLGEYEDPPSEDGINLTQFLPELKEHKNHIGKISLLIFRVFYKNQVFAYWHKADWFETFTNLFEEAKSIFEERERLIKEQQTLQKDVVREQIEKRENDLRSLLEELAADDKFISLKTQKVQQEYALALFPELGELPQHLLKEEISNLNAKIQARKMLQ